jgi:hypothetical protein
MLLKYGLAYDFGIPWNLYFLFSNRKGIFQNNA